MKIIGLLPAAGKATRLSPLPFSKELYPVGFRNINGNFRPKVAIHFLLEKMKLAGVNKAYIVLREGKWDIPSYFANHIIDMDLAFMITKETNGVPYTIVKAFPFIEDKIVAFGFPDILFEPNDSYVKLIKYLKNTKVDVVLGLFPVDDVRKWDIVKTNKDNEIKKIFIKPKKADSHKTWIIAVWRPSFTEFLKSLLDNPSINEVRELFIGEVFQTAIDHKLKVHGVFFPEGKCIDIGTPEDLIQVVRGNYA